MTKEHMDLFLYFIVVFYDLCVCLWCVVAAEIELGPVRSRQRLSGAGPARLGPAGSSSFLNTDICSSWPWLESGPAPARARAQHTSLHWAQSLGDPGQCHIISELWGQDYIGLSLASGDTSGPLIGRGWWHIWDHHVMWKYHMSWVISDVMWVMKWHDS